MEYGEYRNKRVLVTGGLGFIGSNLTIRLAQLGARVTVLDSCVEQGGGNQRNILPVRDLIRVVLADLKDADRFAGELEPPELIFNLAGEVSHARSMNAPLRDLELNVIAQLAFLQACAAHFPGIRVVYTGTRQVYGRPEFLPVTEDHPVQPIDFNGVHKFAASAYHLLLSRQGVLDGIVLQLTNVYGPRMALAVEGQGFLSVYLRHALHGKPIQVWGDGQQRRDPVHVDDVVEALLRAGFASGTSRVFNLAGPEALEMQRIATIAAAAGNCQLVQRPFSAAEKAIEIGSYYADTSRIARELQWKPRIRFEEGFPETLRFYQCGEPVPVPARATGARAGAGQPRFAEESEVPLPDGHTVGDSASTGTVRAKRIHVPCPSV